MANKYTSLGSFLQITLATVLTTVAGIRDIDFESPELELMDVDDLESTHVDQDPTGRTKGGSVKASAFWDPAAASHAGLCVLFNAPVKTLGVYVPTVCAISWSAQPATVQGFSGTLTKQSRKAERGSPLMCDLEIAVTRKPTLV